MSTTTPNYGLIKPAVNDPIDQDLWGGELNTNMDTLDTVIKAVSDSVATAGQLPIGSLYFNGNVSTNPSSLLGYGTWAAFGAGRFIIGVGTGTDINGEVQTFANAATGGEYRHTLSVAETPTHNHQTLADVASTSGTPPTNSTYANRASGGGLGNLDYQMQGSTTVPSVALTSSSGSGDDFNVLNPYIACYIWKRTA